MSIAKQFTNPHDNQSLIVAHIGGEFDFCWKQQATMQSFETGFQGCSIAVPDVECVRKRIAYYIADQDYENAVFWSEKVAGWVTTYKYWFFSSSTFSPTNVSIYTICFRVWFQLDGFDMRSTLLNPSSPKWTLIPVTRIIFLKLHFGHDILLPNATQILANVAGRSSCCMTLCQRCHLRVSIKEIL